MANEIRPKNFEQVCRLCLEYASKTNTLLPLFINETKVPGFYGRYLEEFKQSIPEVISACIGIEIDPTVKLPLNICATCEKQLIASNQFREKCWQSNEYLLKFQRNCDKDDDNFDKDDDVPLDSLKYPELIIVDRLSDGFKQEDIEMDSSCDSAWNNYDYDNHLKHETNRKETLSIAEIFSAKTESESETVIHQKAALKRSTTISLVAPSKAISSRAMDCNESQPNLLPPKRPLKYKYPKKPKMCTVCGIIVDRLRDHMRTHPDALEYCCAICPRKYLTKKGLVKHMKHKHNEDSSNENKFNVGLDVEDEYKRNLWQSNLRKRLRQMGETYTAVDGTEKTGRSVKSTCPKSCYLKCQSNIGELQRLEIHKSFWKLTDNEKDRFYANNVKRVNSVRKRTKAEHSQRSFSFTYFFNVCENDEVSRRVQVCQKFFTWTLDISKGRIYYYFRNIHDGESKGPRIGRHTKKRRIKTENC